MIGPRPNIYDADKARLLCQASANAYAQAGEGVMVDDTTTDTRVILNNTENGLIVAFRGTAYLRNWITDADARFEKWDEIKIHAGFWNALESVWGDMCEEISNPKQVWFTGHSLGGALAMLAAYRFDLEFPGMVQGVYTFGQPRVGNAMFRNAYNSALKGKTFRIVHNDDVIPRVPWLLGSYRHSGHEVEYYDLDHNWEMDMAWPDKLVADLPGLIRELRHGKLALLEDHHISRYLLLFA